MTPEEREMLAELADKIAKTPAPAHDPEADEFIRTNIGKRPDALYILTQTTLIQNLAIQHAHQEIQELKQRLAQPSAAQPTSSFLGAGPTLGGARPGGVPGSSPWSSPTPVPVPQDAPPAAERPSFLRSAAQTAAGVAAGAFAFEGIRALFGGGGFGGWGGPHLGSSSGGSFLGGAPGGETIINNYYDKPDASDRDVSERTASHDRSSGDSSSNDAEASADSGDTASDSDDTSSDEDTYADDTSYDDGGGSGGDDFA
jgi:hypothetical protein